MKTTLELLKRWFQENADMDPYDPEHPDNALMNRSSLDLKALAEYLDRRGEKE